MKKQSAISNQPSVIRQRGFTLVEILVVISVIALVLSITLPSVIGLFTAGSDLQARNVISGMLGAARGEAIENQSYALVHVQIDADGDKCWAAVMKYDSTTGKFVPVSGFPPQQMPADMAFGEISTDYVSGSGYRSEVNSDLKGFTTFNVIFGPDGSLATTLPGGDPVIDTTAACFAGTDKQKIWNPGDVEVEAGVRAITAFHYRTLEAMPNRQGWLEKNGQFLCVNPYTGKLLLTKQ